MKVIIKILTLICVTAIILNNGCSSEANVNCVECIFETINGLHSKPTKANLKILVTINNENPIVPIKIYKQKYTLPPNEPPIYLTVQAKGDTIISLPVDNYYSVKASYKSGTDSTFAIDGGQFSTQEINQTCNERCWLIKNDNLDVKLIR